MALRSALFLQRALLALAIVSLRALPAAAQAPTAAASTEPPIAEQKLPPRNLNGGFDRALFARPLAQADLDYVKTFAGKTTNDFIKDKQIRKFLKQVMPDGEFHYGRDMPLADAMDLAMKGSKSPVMLQEDRYILVAGAEGPYLGGRAFLWFDTKEDIALGGFFFQPTNGEPTPALSVFSRQVMDLSVAIDQLPEAFLNDMAQWATAYHLPPVTTRYFLTGSNKRILLEHDEDFCPAQFAPNDPCQQTMAYAADVDETAAYYLVQIHYATNGTAWMIGSDQRAFLTTRDHACGVVLACRIRITREHTHVMLRGRR